MLKNHSVRLGIVGLGNIAQQHIENIISGAVQSCEISAVCCRSETNFTKSMEATYFSRYQKLVDSGKVDAIVIATPTFSHYEIAKYALERNIHVMLEKPIGLSSFEGEKLLSYAENHTKFALMLNQRIDPTYAKMKEVVDSGVLGKIQRTQWTMTNWFRPEIYFQASDWRATWKGEGGGLLVNQCIHNLDIYQWICGMPDQVTAFCEFGKYHGIEVEDEVTAYFRYGNQSTGTFVGSTGEAPGVNQFDIVGDQGSLHFDSGKLIQKINQQSTSRFCNETNDMFGMPEYIESDISNKHVVNQHATVLNNFINAILNDEPLITPAKEGLGSLDLANAMLLSTWQNQPISLPLNRAQYQQVLAEHIAQSSLRTKTDAKANIDMSKSYR